MAIMTKGTKAITADFLTTSFVERLSSSSSEPSKTIRIRPTVPKIGKITLRFGTMILKSPPT